MALNGKEIGDTTLIVEKAKERDGDEKSGKSPGGKQNFADKDAKTLFVKNLAEDTTEDSLKKFFPDSVEIRMPRKPDDSHKG